MLDSISVSGAITSLFLPWLCGSVWVLYLLRRTGRWNGYIVAGQGYMLGIFITTLLIRFWGFAGMPLHYWGMAATLSALTMAGVFALRRQPANANHNARKPTAPLEIWQRFVVAILLALVTLRYSGITQEILLRPLFPWDGWMNWAPKAAVWFNFQEMVPFVSPEDWLAAPNGALNYTEGAGKAWKYPITVPLVQLWGMLGLGMADNTLVYLPWLFVAIAMGLALYGHLRLSNASIPLAMLACYVLMDLPFINVHVALAGYADIWVAATFGCAVFALHEWEESRQWPYAALALILALMCTQLKIPGLIMGGIVALVFLSSVIHFSKGAWLTVSIVVLFVIAIVIVEGINFTIPGLGQVTVSLDSIVLPYIGQYVLEYHAIHDAILNTIFLMLNWNILWYVFVMLSAIWLVKQTHQAQASLIPSLELRALLITLLFIFFVYYFTSRYKFAQDFTQINRALVYSVPVMVFYLFTTAIKISKNRETTPHDDGLK